MYQFSLVKSTNQCFIKHSFVSSLSLPKNEEGLEFTFLDSLNLYKKEGREVHSHVFYIMGASIVSLNKAPILSLSTVGSQFLTLSQFRVFTPPVGIFSNYMGNLAMSPTLYICFVGPISCQKLPKSLFCCAHCSRIKPLSAILQLP